MLSDVGLELPWKYALHLDCNAEYMVGWMDGERLGIMGDN